MENFGIKYCLKFMFFVLLFDTLIDVIHGEIPNLRKCADKLCEEKISQARTTQSYVSPEKGILNFKIDELAIIYSKEAEPDSTLWGVEINGRRGFIPKSFVREEKIFVKDSLLTHLIPTTAQKTDATPQQEAPVIKDKKEEAPVGSEQTITAGVNEKSSEETNPSIIGEDSEFDALKKLIQKNDQGENHIVENVEKIKSKNLLQSEHISENEGAEINVIENDPVESTVNSVIQDHSKENVIHEQTEETVRPFLERRNENLLENEHSHEKQVVEIESNVDVKNDYGEPSLYSAVDDQAKESLIQKQTEEAVKPVDSIKGEVEEGLNGGKKDSNNHDYASEKNEINGENSKIIDDQSIRLELQDKVENTDEQVDNEDEGNGNEGEENGSEYKMENESNKEDQTYLIDENLSTVSPKDVTVEGSDKEFGASVPEHLSTNLLANSEDQVNVDVPPVSSSVPEEDKSSLGSVTQQDSNNNDAKENLPQPTPSLKYEVIDGTTIYLNDAEDTQLFTDSLPPLSTPLPLQASQHSIEVVHTTPSPPLYVPPYDSDHAEKPELASGNVEEYSSGEKTGSTNHHNTFSQNSNPTTTKFPEKTVEINEGINSDSQSIPVEGNSLTEGGSSNVIENNFVPKENSTIKLDTTESPVLNLNSKEEGTLNIDNHFGAPKPESVMDNSLLEMGEVVTNDPPKESEEKGGFLASLMSNAFGALKSSLEDVASNTVHEQVDENAVENKQPKLDKPDVAVANIKFIDPHADKPESSSSGPDSPIAAEETAKTSGEVDPIEKQLSDSKLQSSSEQKIGDMKLQTSNAEGTGREQILDNQEDINPTEATGNQIVQSNFEKSAGDETAHSPVQKGQPTSANSILISPHYESVPNKESDDKVLEAEMSSLTEQILNASQPFLSDNMAVAIEGELAHLRFSGGTATFLTVVSVTIMVLYLLHLVMVKVSRETPLLETMNTLDRKQRILTEENNSLKKKLAVSNGQIKTTLSTHVDPMQIKELKEELEAVQAKNSLEIEELKERNEQLEADLEASTANEVELHRMLSELLSSQKDTTTFEDSVNNLQAMLDGQSEKVENLTSDLAMKTRLNDELRNELKLAKSRESKLESQIEQLTHSLEEVNISKHEYREKLDAAENGLLSLQEAKETLIKDSEESKKQYEALNAKSAKEYEVLRDKTEKLQQTVKELKEKLNIQEAECQVLKECLKKIKMSSEDGGNDVKAKLAELFKIVDVKAKLISSEKERLSLIEELKEAEDRHIQIVNSLKQNQDEANQLRENLTKIKSERDAAQSKLEILSQYHEEKEEKLKRELESQEGLRHDAEGSIVTVSTKIQGYKAELASCRSQIESLKQELEEQKQSFKIQMANEDKKLQDSWVAARAAERRQEELRQENTQLRQLLTQMQRKTENQHIIKPPVKRVDANGSISSPIPADGELDGLHSPNSPPLDWDGSMPPIPPLLLPMFAGRPPHMAPGHPHQPPPPPPPPSLHPGLHHPHPFLSHLPPPPPPLPYMPDRRLPPAGRIASPPGYDRRSYSPSSDHSHYSDRYSPGPRYSPGGGQRTHSNDRRSDRSRRAPTNYGRRDQRSPSPMDRIDRHSPNRLYTQSSQVFNMNRRSPPHGYYGDGMDDNKKMVPNSGKEKLTSTPLGPNDT